MRILIFLLLLLTNNAKVVAMKGNHPLHFSFITIDISSGNQALVAIRIFKDDLRTILLNNYNVAVDADNEQLSDEGSTAIFNYISKNLIIVAKQKNLKLLPTEIKFRDNEMFIYCRFNMVHTRELNITGSILFDLYPDQKNMLIVKSTTDQGFELTFGSNTARIEILRQ